MAFDQIQIEAGDSTERAVSRTLLQFRRSPVFLEILGAFISQVQELLDAIIAVIYLRSPADARSVNLDALGRIVGQMRSLIGFDAIAWFQPDRDRQGADSVPVWVTNAPISGDYVAADSWFRQLIEAKVSRNFTRHASVPEIQAFVHQAFNMDISFRRIDTMTIQVIVPDSTDFNTMSLFERHEEINRTEHVYFLPFAAGVRIGSVIRLSDL